MTKRKPPDLRLLEGNPGKRPIKKRGVTPTGDAVAPVWLSEGAAAVWSRVVDAMPGVFKATDAEILTAYCCAADQHQRATLALAIEGPILTGPRGRQSKNPWLAVQKDAANAIERLGRRLGLDPTSREHLPQPAPQPASSKFAGLVGAGTSPTEKGTNDDDD
ncbi:MAG: phage terminase small subunit P27 family [Rhodospirillales bacterium]